MRRINASRPVANRRATRRRRAIAPSVPADHWRFPLRSDISRLAGKMWSRAVHLAGLGVQGLAAVRGIPVGAGYRHVAVRIRAAHAVIQARLKAGLELVGHCLAQSAAALLLTGGRARRWIAGITLPDVPGGDPVRFGAAAGIAVIAAAGLVVLVGTQIIGTVQESETVAELSDDEGGGSPRDGQSVDRAAPDAASRDNEAEIPHIARGLTGGVAEPAPVLATNGAPADQGENLAAALPLLDIPADRSPAHATTRPERPPLAVLPPLRDTRPPALAPRPQWLANAVQTPYPLGRNPMIAIVIDDAGIAQARTARAIELPSPLSIAFIPYGRNLKQQTNRARQNGHELLLHIPMEPGSSTVDPGPNALLTSLDEDEIMRRFRWALSRFDGYVGVNNHMGSKFMARADLVAPLLAEMNARGLMFLDSRTDRTTVGADLARGMDLPHASRQIFLDNDLDAGKIEAQLAELERIARQRGHAIAIGHPHDVTVDVLTKWIPEVRARGIDLVPVSAIVKLEYGDGAGSQLAAAAGGGESDGLLSGAQ